MREGNGELIVCEKGTEQFRVGKGSEVAVIDVSDPRAYVAFARGNIASGEAYMNKLWESPDLACLFRVIGRNLKHYNQNIEAGLRKKYRDLRNLSPGWYASRAPTPKVILPTTTTWVTTCLPSF